MTEAGEITVEKSPHIERMEGELAELSDRSAKLTAFVNESTVFAGLASVDQCLLTQQLAAMRQYECVLAMRLRRAA